MVLHRERLIIGCCLAAMVILAWLYLFHTKTAMPGMDMTGMDMPGMVMLDLSKWGPATVLLLFVMWTVMMVAMMVPSATPMIFTFLSVNQRRKAADRPYVPTAIFVLGYLAVWTAFSATSTFAEWGLHQAAMLSTTMTATNTALNGGLLIAAGIFQWTPLKRACLKACRSPLSFLMSEWREGSGGAFVMGLRHGAYCAGCCWFLMALLFVAGVMNLLWVAVIALFVMAEKISPKGEFLARVAGVALMIAGAALLAHLR
jgi:predicted metal-binding membrane protein